MEEIILVFSANNSDRTANQSISGNESEEFARFLAHFKHKTFLKHDAQCFQQYTLLAAYESEKAVPTQNKKISQKHQFSLFVNAIDIHFMEKGEETR